MCLNCLVDEVNSWFTIARVSSRPFLEGLLYKLCTLSCGCSACYKEGVSALLRLETYLMSLSTDLLILNINFATGTRAVHKMSFSSRVLNVRLRFYIFQDYSILV